VREIDAAYVEPHVDKPYKPITVIFYLAEPNDTDHLGTMLCPVGDSSIASGRGLQISFRANSALLLPRTEKALHGVVGHRFLQPRNTLHLYIQDAEQQSSKTIDPNLDRKA
jgi:hypothetical protein